MARYIDADKLIVHLKDEIEGCKPPFGGRANGKSIAYGTILGLKSAISFAETLPTADVAPKSEVDRLVDKWIGSGELTPDEKTLRLIEQLRDEAKRYERYYFNHEYDKLIAEAKAEVAREIFEEIKGSIAVHAYTSKSEDYADGAFDTIEWVDSKIAELEKKYTEGESNG